MTIAPDQDNPGVIYMSQSAPGELIQSYSGQDLLERAPLVGFLPSLPHTSPPSGICWEHL